jgi:hypothetical protein
MELKARGLLAGGKTFDGFGPYEYIAGVLHFTADPRAKGHEVICDIELAPTNSEGLIEYSAEFHLLKPVHPPSAGRLLVDSVNRGLMTAVTMFNNAAWRADASWDVDTGNGYLMRQGYSVLSVALQWDPPDSPERMRASFPEATENGERLIGSNFIQWWPARPTSTQLLSDMGHRPYRTADLNDPTAELSVREHHDAQPNVIPREHWSFAQEVDGQIIPSDEHICLAPGFQPGYVYELCYTAVGAPVIGLAFLAYRDAASFFRYSTSVDNPLAGLIEHVYGWGVSMNGRWLREFLYLGLNRDEADRKVVDGLFIHVGSSRRGEFNLRFGQPSTNILRAPGNVYPFAFEATPEPVLEQNMGLLDRSRANDCMPKVIHVNSGVEYWWSGASLGHTTIDGEHDLDPPDDVRLYYIAGSQHGPGSMPLSYSSPDGFRTRHLLNTLDYRPALRGLLKALDEWVRAGVDPPACRIPRIADGTAVTRESLKATFGRIPGAIWVEHLPQRKRMYFGPMADGGIMAYPSEEIGTYPTLVSAVDDDGNEVAGIRLPDVSVPLATYTGWNVRHESMGQPGLMSSSAGSPLCGSTLVFPLTASSRTETRDPRMAVEERYESREGYLSKVQDAAHDLVAQRYLLEEDVGACVSVAADKWDAIQSGQPSS